VGSYTYVNDLWSQIAGFAPKTLLERDGNKHCTPTTTAELSLVNGVQSTYPKKNRPFHGLNAASNVLMVG
jgi:hypothetical protein